MEQFNIPVVIFFFKREEKTVQIIERISHVKPKKIYLISDGPRNEIEAERVLHCRSEVEKAITWDCEIVRNYAEENKGVFERIGLGAKWVLSREESAIFLEDDNLPEITFFRFCQEMLERYRDDLRVLWICGTNYLKEYEPQDGSSYVFTRHMMPCGWASWSNKFPRFYEADLDLWKDPYIKERIKHEYDYKPLMKQDMGFWDKELERTSKGERPNSWDGQMSFTQRVHGLYAIVPKYNQITNIGVDADSTHGGVSFDNIMIQRFCGLPTKQMVFPLVHPRVVLPDLRFENLNNKIITLPLTYRIQGVMNKILKKILFVNANDSLTGTIKKRLKI